MTKKDLKLKVEDIHKTLSQMQVTMTVQTGAMFGDILSKLVVLYKAIDELKLEDNDLKTEE